MNHFTIAVQKDKIVFQADFHLYREPQCMAYYINNGWLHKLFFRSNNWFYSQYGSFNFRGKPTNKNKWEAYLGPVALSNPILQKIDKDIIFNTSNGHTHYDNRNDEEKMLDQNKNEEIEEQIKEDEEFYKKIVALSKDRIAQLHEQFKLLYEKIRDKDTFDKILYDEIFDRLSYDNLDNDNSAFDDSDYIDFDEDYTENDNLDTDSYYQRIFENFIKHEGYLLDLQIIVNAAKLKNVNPKLQKYKDEDINRVTQNIISTGLLTSEDGFVDYTYDKSILIRNFASIVYSEIQNEETERAKEEFLLNVESRVKRILGDLFSQIQDTNLFIENIKTECNEEIISSRKKFNELVRNKSEYVLRFQEIGNIIDQNHSNRKAIINLDENNLNCFSNSNTSIYKYIEPIYTEHIYIKGSSKIKPSILKLKSSGAYVEKVFDIIINHKLLYETDSDFMLNDSADTKKINEEIIKLEQ